LSLFGTFGDEGEWEVASGQSIKVVCRRRILKSIRERTERTLTPDAQPKSDADADQREAEKKRWRSIKAPRRTSQRKKS
jgi:hypothetical protein